TATMSPSPTPTVAPTTAFTFAPVADAYISKTKPTLTFGASNMLRVYGGPLGARYLRFYIQGFPASAGRATLRLYPHSQPLSGFQVHGVNDNTWSEAALNYQNALPVGDLITASEGFAARQWISVDLTSLIKGNGMYNIVIITFNGAPVSFASRESIPPYH